MNIRKVLVFSVILSMFFFVACGNKNEDIEEIMAIPLNFIEALADSDSDAIDDLTHRYDFDREISDYREYCPENLEIINHVISLTEITEYSEPEINKKELSAYMDITISYIDMDDFLSELDYMYLTIDEYYEAIDAFEEREEATITLNFAYDEEEEVWLLKKSSANKLVNLFIPYALVIENPVPISVNQTEDLLLEYMENLTHSDHVYITYEIATQVRNAYSNAVFGNLDLWNMIPAYDFVVEYMNYVLSHDYVIEHGTYPYDLTFIGSAPSSEELYQVFYTDEFRTQFYMNQIRYMYLGMPDNAFASDQSTLVIESLTAAIPNCSSEPYELQANIGELNDLGSHVHILSDLILEPERGIFEFDHGATVDQLVSGFTMATEELYAIGEIDEEQYEELLSTFTPEFFGQVNEGNVSPGGHPDQAVGVSESIPWFAEDGSLVYGYSTTDDNGFWMQYTKEPGWLDTVGYYLDDEGIWITAYFDRSFEVGTNLIVDWWVDGDQIIDTEIVTIEENGTTAVEVYLPTGGFPNASTYEMRLWEDDHSHVIAYVILNNEMNY